MLLEFRLEVLPCFNPHPPLLAGETVQLARAVGIYYVSIHTRHYWRVKLVVAACAARFIKVSIHTRHYWRVKHAACAYRVGLGLVSIHTRHYWRVKRHCHPGASGGCSRFQSTPAITGG